MYAAHADAVKTPVCRIATGRLDDALFDEFRPELIRRYRSVNVWDQRDLIDRIIEVEFWRVPAATKPPFLPVTCFGCTRDMSRRAAGRLKS